jgi:hypothetical protein
MRWASYRVSAFDACASGVHGGVNAAPSGEFWHQRHRQVSSAVFSFVSFLVVFAVVRAERVVEPAQIVGVAPHVGEGASRGIGIRKCRNAGCIQDRGALGYVVCTHPAGEDRLAGAPGVWRHALGNLRGIGESLRRYESVAPITATDRGRKNDSSEQRAAGFAEGRRAEGDGT